MKAGVIGRAIGGVERLFLVLESFNPQAVIDKYAGDWEAILDDIVERLEPRGEIRRMPRSIWPHFRDIFTALRLCQDKADDYQLFKTVIRVAGNAGVSAYNADKVFWLIGSGYFYSDLYIGSQGRVGSRKKEFIEYAKPLLENV